jgi:hypothetical protein
VESGQRPIAGEDRIEGWEAEIDRLFVGLRRSVGVSHGPGTIALLATEEGQRLESAKVIHTGDDRLMVTRPLLTDMVQRAVLDLQPPQGWAKPEGGDNVLVDA